MLQVLALEPRTYNLLFLDFLKLYILSYALGNIFRPLGLLAGLRLLLLHLLAGLVKLLPDPAGSANNGNYEVKY